MTLDEIIAQLTEIRNANPERGKDSVFVYILERYDIRPIEDIDVTISDRIDLNISYDY